MSKYGTTQYNHFDKVRNSVYSLYRSVHFRQMTFNEYLKEKKERVYNHPSYARLKGNAMGHISGIGEALYGQIEKSVEWKHFYKNKSGKTIYVKDWGKLPNYIKETGEFYSNHFWKDTTKPWEDKAKKGTGTKRYEK